MCVIAAICDTPAPRPRIQKAPRCQLQRGAFFVQSALVRWCAPCTSCYWSVLLVGWYQYIHSPLCEAAYAASI